jgi:chaperonin GroES
MNWKPLFDRVLLKAITAEHKVGGLFIPDTSTNLKKGIVVAAGEGKGNPMSVRVGQEVLFKPEDGTPITLEEQQYLILRETDLWMKN